MLIPITDADRIVLDLRYASVDDPLGRALQDRAAAPLRRPPRDASVSLGCDVAVLGHSADPCGVFPSRGDRASSWKLAAGGASVAGPYHHGIAVDLTLGDGDTGARRPMGTGIEDVSTASAQNHPFELAPEAVSPRACPLGPSTARSRERRAPEGRHHPLGRDTDRVTPAADVQGCHVGTTRPCV